jgi:hypothetical protein
MKTTTALVNKALKQQGIKEYLVKGKGVCFFAGGNAHVWPSSGVKGGVESLTVEQWVDKHRELSTATKTAQGEVQHQPAPAQHEAEAFQKLRSNVIKEGVEVRLKKGVAQRWSCPEGRENNRKARVLICLKAMENVVYTDRDLRGRRAWNIDDLEVVG